jgi:uncharacterized protein
VEGKNLSVEEPQTRLFKHTGFGAYLAEHKLMGSRCLACGEIAVPPFAMCPRCYGTEMEWIEFSGQGQLIGYTAIFVGLPEMTKEGFGREHPYCSGVVQLKEGPAVCGQILGVDCAHPETIEIGMPLRVKFIERGSGEDRRVVLAFEKEG